MNPAGMVAKTSSSTYAVERILLETGLTFAALSARFERQLGVYDQDVGVALTARRAPWDEASRTISAMAGPHGLMIVKRLDLGLTASLKGRPLQCSLYLIGNPVIATEIVGHDLRAGLLVPFRVEIYAANGVACLTYDSPASSLRSLGNAAVDVIGETLNAKMRSVIAAMFAADPQGEAT